MREKIRVELLEIIRVRETDKTVTDNWGVDKSNNLYLFWGYYSYSDYVSTSGMFRMISFVNRHGEDCTTG